MNNVEEHMGDSGVSLRKVTKLPLMKNYIPECDVMGDLKNTNSIYYASLIVILRWMV